MPDNVQDPLYPVNEPSTAKKGGKLNGKAILLIGGAVVVMLYQMGILGGGNDPASTQADSSTSTQARKNDPAPPTLEEGDAIGFSTIEPSDRSALVLMQNNMQQMNRRLNDLVTAQNTAQQRQVEFEQNMSNSIDRKLRELTGMIQELAVNRAGEVRATGIADIGPDGLPIIDGQPLLPGLDPEKKKTDTFAYRAYGVAHTNANGEPMSPSARAASDILGLNDKANNASNATENTRQTVRTSIGVDEKKQTSSAMDIFGTVTGADNTMKIEVPAGSFATVRNLHGVDCPVGGGMVDDLFSNVPASMVVTGDFRGPNGALINLRRAQLIGSCVGQRSTERARFRITHLSYFDELDKQHYVPVQGYVNDTRDNSLDVAGFLISSRVSDVAKSAAATALSTGANFLSASQFTNVTGAATGTTSTSMTGSLGQSIAGASAADAFGTIAEMYAQEVKASMEVVRVPAGVDMTFHILQPFTMTLPDDDYDHRS